MICQNDQLEARAFGNSQNQPTGLAHASAGRREDEVDPFSTACTLGLEEGRVGLKVIRQEQVIRLILVHRMVNLVRMHMHTLSSIEVEISDGRMF